MVYTPAMIPGRLLIGLLLAAAMWGADGREVFLDHCAACHGNNARGTAQGPGLEGNPRLRGQSVEQLRDIVRRGFPNAGMPAIELASWDLDAVADYVRSLNIGSTVAAAGGQRVVWGKPAPG